jgi:hypothetical protein
MIELQQTRPGRFAPSTVPGYELKIVGDLVTITRDATEQRF